MKMLCIIHAFYPEFLPEIASVVRNIGACDIAVTYSQDQVLSEVHRLFPTAKIVKCENVGYDVWPFLKILNTVRLEDYDYLVKLHTKRDVKTDGDFIIKHRDLANAKWRESLLSFASTPEAWTKTLKLLTDDPTVGMVAGRDCILRKKETPWGDAAKGFDKAMRLAEELGIEVRNPQFVGGTMFVVRSAILKPFRGRFNAADFLATRTHHTSTLGHYLERTFGFASSTAQYRITDPDDRIAAFHRLNDFLDFLEPVKRFFYRVKKQENGGTIVKIMKIPVWRIKNTYLSDRKDNDNCVFVRDDFNSFLDGWDYANKKVWFVFEREHVEFTYPLGAYLDCMGQNHMYGIAVDDSLRGRGVDRPQAPRTVDQIAESILVVHSELVYNLRLRFDSLTEQTLLNNFIHKTNCDFGVITKCLGIKTRKVG